MKIYITVFCFLALTLSASGSTSGKMVCTYQVSGMTCGSCTVTLEAGVRKLDGIQRISASVEEKRAVVTFDPAKTDDEHIKSAIDRIGYKAVLKQCKPG